MTAQYSAIAAPNQQTSNKNDRISLLQIVN